MIRIMVSSINIEVELKFDSSAGPVTVQYAS